LYHWSRRLSGGITRTNDPSFYTDIDTISNMTETDEESSEDEQSGKLDKIIDAVLELIDLV